MSTLAPLSQHLRDTAAAHPLVVAQRELVDEVWQEWTYAEFAERCRGLAAHLVAAGLAVGDRVAIVSPNCPAWSVVDYGAMSAGASVVPVHLASSTEQKTYVLRHSQAHVVAVLGDEELARVAGLLADEGVRQVLAIECSQDARESAATVLGAEVVDLEEAISAGHAASASTHDEVAHRLDSADLDALATVLYTSGTTGTPKAVPLTHRNLTTQFATIADRFDFTPGQRSLSFLPLSHALERAWAAFGVQQGLTIAYCRNPKEVQPLLAAAEPQVLVSVPRLYERVYAGAHANADSSRITRALFDWALRVGLRRNRRRRSGLPVEPWAEAAYRVADRLVLHRIRDVLGGPKTCMAVGGAALRREVEEFLLAADLLVSQGYGLSETSPVISCPGVRDWRFGTVGRPIAGMEVRIVPQPDGPDTPGVGEIQARGDGVFAGYLPNADGTDPNEGAFTEDGWFRTGDLGRLDEDGYLTLTGRSKEIIVTDGGRNIAPAAIEGVLDSDSLIEYSMVVGDGRPYLVAVVSPDAAACAEAFPGASARDLARAITERVTELTSDMARYERITKVVVAEEPFTMEGGELTPTLKVRRAVVADKWAEEIDALYR
ncbi:AMP-dependent synthetase/ligase [Kytococcus sedentarius]|uniref:AMP-dependent synthetase/ligase n=1 Tax=Kytococcus sedentarius TaxID=1276 RepID=UPI003879402C